MKKVMKLAAAVVGVVFFCVLTGGIDSASAQKLGFIDSGALIQSMPDIADVQTKMQTLQKDLEENYELMTVEFNNKMDFYSKNASTMTDIVRKDKENELGKLRERIQEFEASASENMQQEQSKLMAPIVEKARNAIEKVSSSNGFTAVFDLSSGAIAYHNTTTMIDIMPMVKAELGIQ